MNSKFHYIRWVLNSITPNLYRTYLYKNVLHSGNNVRTLLANNAAMLAQHSCALTPNVIRCKQILPPSVCAHRRWLLFSPWVSAIVSHFHWDFVNSNNWEVNTYARSLLAINAFSLFVFAWNMNVRLRVGGLVTRCLLRILWLLGTRGIANCGIFPLSRFGPGENSRKINT